MNILDTESILLRAFGHTRAYVGKPIDNQVNIVTSFKGKEYVFIYEGTGEKLKIRDCEVQVFELTEMRKHGH
jgi:hypothetical protein